jgi:cytosine deaminase
MLPSRPQSQAAVSIPVAPRMEPCRAPQPPLSVTPQQSNPGMLLLQRARVPAAVLQVSVASPAPDPMEPSVLCDIGLDGAVIRSVVRSGDAAGSPGAVDLRGAMVFPGFVDAHVHLDKAHTWDRAPNRSGRFAEALETWPGTRRTGPGKDLLRRAGFALACAWEHGTRAVRTHVDTWLPWGEANHAAMDELRERLEGPHRAPDGAADRHRELFRGRGRRGRGPRHEIRRVRARRLVAHVARPAAPAGPAARDREGPGRGLDLHVDENGNPAEEVLRAVAEAVLRNRFANPVVCGHCCSLAVQPPERQRSTIALVRDAGIRVISLPLCNLYLQDRRGQEFPRTPFWRGLTLIHDLLDAGVPLACASDNVRDAFHAYGDFDAAEVLIQSVRLAHLDSRLAAAVGAVSCAAADIVGPRGRGERSPRGRPSQLVVFPSRSFSEFLSRPGLGAPPRRRRHHQGRPPARIRGAGVTTPSARPFFKSRSSSMPTLQ